jgi:hypothetical protein
MKTEVTTRPAISPCYGYFSVFQEACDPVCLAAVVEAWP